MIREMAAVDVTVFVVLVMAAAEVTLLTTVCASAAVEVASRVTD